MAGVDNKGKKRKEKKEKNFGLGVSSDSFSQVLMPLEG